MLLPPDSGGKAVKLFYTILGSAALCLGAVGTVLPILPTTPLLLLAAFCFARSSEKLDRWFKGTKLYQDNLETFANGQGMTGKAKLRIMTTVTVIMAIAFVAMKNTSVGRICLCVVWLCHVVAFLFFIKTCPEQA